jgi:hypothetical protein
MASSHFLLNMVKVLTMVAGHLGGFCLVEVEEAITGIHLTCAGSKSLIGIGIHRVRGSLKLREPIDQGLEHTQGSAAPHDSATTIRFRLGGLTPLFPALHRS